MRVGQKIRSKNVRYNNFYRQAFAIETDEQICRSIIWADMRRITYSYMLFSYVVVYDMTYKDIVFQRHLHPVICSPLSVTKYIKLQTKGTL